MSMTSLVHVCLRVADSMSTMSYS